MLDSLKDNREDLNSILNLRDVNVQYYITEAKQIDWDALLAGLNDIMAFIKESKGRRTYVSRFSTNQCDAVL